MTLETNLLILIFFLFFGIYGSAKGKFSITFQNLGLQRYPPLASNEEQLSTNQRFQQIMQGGGNAPKVVEKINVKSEIEKLNTSYSYQSSWPSAKVKLGSVTAVSFDKAGNVVIFHRCDRVWMQNTFDNGNVFRQRNKGPIKDNTVLAFESVSGSLVYQWGKNLFYMPHGLTIDNEDNVWITDVALHQVFKFAPRGQGGKPLLSLGTPFTPGAGESKFCKPTSVAVLDNGDFFVADGYCNARILKYSKDGTKILSWGQNTFAGISHEVAPINFFAIPHALTLVTEKELICTADRENGRIQCFFWSNGTFHSQYHSQIIGDRLFSMAYTPVDDGQFIIVNGPIAEMGFPSDTYNEVRGYVMSMKSNQVISKFGPNDMQFANPHDVAVTADGKEIYVAELNPQRIYKFVHKSVAKSVSLSPTEPIHPIGSEYSKLDSIQNVTNTLDLTNNKESNSSSHKAPSSTAILVASLMLLFAFFTFAMALLIARRRKRGNAHLGVGQPSELVYRKLVASNQNVCEENT